MNGPRLWEILAASQADGAALTASVAQTSILHATGKYTMAAGYAEFVGRRFKTRLQGRISTLNPTPGNLTLSFRMGANDAFSSGAMVLNIAAAKVNVAFWAEFEGTLRVAGSVAQILGQWKVESEAMAVNSATALVTGVTFGPASAPALGTAFDATAAETIDVTGQWSVNSASNSITIHQSIIEVG